jgi:hypothetical protein
LFFLFCLSIFLRYRLRSSHFVSPYFGGQLTSLLP